MGSTLKESYRERHRADWEVEVTESEGTHCLLGPQHDPIGTSMGKKYHSLRQVSSSLEQ